MRNLSKRLVNTLAVLSFLAIGCSDTDDPHSLIGTWNAVAIHLPEGLTAHDGSDRIDMEEYGSGELAIGEDSTFKSMLRVSKDLRVTKSTKAGDIALTLLPGRTTSERIGHYRDSSGYLILEQPNFVSSSRYQLQNGVLTTTTTVKGFPIQTIWHRSD